MTNNKPQILLTNDDSIASPGLWAAAEALAPLGFVHVAAPRVQQTSMGRALPRESDGIINTLKMTVHGKEWQVYSVGGSPAQAFLHGVYRIMGQKPDLVVSGINYGENVGTGVTVSGTIGAAIEAASLGIPALAVSLETPSSQHYSLSSEVDFTIAGYFTGIFADFMLKTRMPYDVNILKVDVPNNATQETPWRITRQSRERHFFPITPKEAAEETYNGLGYEVRLNEESIESDSDLRAVLIDKVVSVTPLSIDLTSRIDLSLFDQQLRELA